jgi:hypothetical protein
VLQQGGFLVIGEFDRGGRLCHRPFRAEHPRGASTAERPASPSTIGSSRGLDALWLFRLNADPRAAAVAVFAPISALIADAFG